MDSLYTSNPISSKFDKTEECFAMANIFNAVLVQVSDADLVALLEVEEPGCVAHDLHLQPPVLLTLDGDIVIHQHREALVLVLVRPSHL